VTAKRIYGLMDNVQLKASLESKKPAAFLKIPGLIPTLRPYQQAAVEWMLRRERQPQAVREWELAWIVVVASLTDDRPTHLIPLHEWARCKGDSDHHSLFICPFMGWLATSYQEAQSMTLTLNPSSPIKGGILAEAMGLGKTVEVLACILGNPCPKGHFFEMKESSVSAKRRLDFSEESGVTEEPTPIVLEMDLSGGSYGQTAAASNGEDVDDADDEPEFDWKPPVAVTPESDAFHKPIKPEERWVDFDHEFEACICGANVDMSSSKNVICVCKSCAGPMHMECAAFLSKDDCLAETAPLVYKVMMSNQTMSCRLCDEDRCPCCAAEKLASSNKEGGLILSRATLIVTPASIISQWQREIQRHTGGLKALKVAVYPGLRELFKQQQGKKARSRSKEKGNSFHLVHPKNLADADVVLMTFDSLMDDLGHSNDNPFVRETTVGSSLRYRKRYRVIPSPLSAIKFWRICLDEAQRVETPTSQSAQMALKLEASNRWCVSGTPVGRGSFDDLFGLLLFLRCSPFCDKQWFTRCLSSAHRGVDERMWQLLRTVFWRSTKAFDIVQEQMGIPEQIEKKVILRFSSVEKHFYNLQLEQTLSIAGDLAENEKNGKRRRATQLDLLSNQLHRLRAACCHPQIGASGISRKMKSSQGKGISSSPGVSVGSGVLSMDQILDRLIDDAKLKCEEAQRLSLMHTNAMAALSMLKVEAKDRGVTIREGHMDLVTKSCKLYEEALRIGEVHAKPTFVVGEAVLTGNVGFRHSRSIIRDGRSTLDWQLREDNALPREMREVWSRIDFEMSRKITQIRIRSVCELPKDLAGDDPNQSEWQLAKPKDCVFCVFSAAVGAFVDVASFQLPATGGDDNAWILTGGFRTNKSKSWLIRVNSFHEERVQSNAMYSGLEVELFEATIANDSLQRLHSLHNAASSFTALLELKPQSDIQEKEDLDEIRDRIGSMQVECKAIESLYTTTAAALHVECRRRLENASSDRKQAEDKLFQSTPKRSTGIPLDCWNIGWWDDFLVLCELYGTDEQKATLLDRLQQDLEQLDTFSVAGGSQTRKKVQRKRLTAFSNIAGLRVSLSILIDDLRSTEIKSGGHQEIIQAVSALSTSPSDGELFENSHCQRCKADWFQTGPVCFICQLEDKLDRIVPSALAITVLTTLYVLLRGNFGAGLHRAARASTRIDEQAKLFFDVLEAEKKERLTASKFWRVHLDLLNDLDELNQCKSAMRLTLEGENLSEITEEQLNAVVQPIDVASRYMEHESKQAMALSNLRRNEDTLRYLKNQSVERSDENLNEKDQTCIVCLSGFDGDRAVLQCGHSFHSTCLEKLCARSGGSRHMISCPLRCTTKTKRDDVLIASNKRSDDGSKNTRNVIGSWGTKVTRLVADLQDMRDLGEKGIVFSMYDELLHIVSQALSVNRINFVRVKSLKEIGACTARFRSTDCSVLLLNVKNGAEGLTLVQATHVFMIEPLLNCGLDSQAINRVHRIGQTSKTYVHRYLIEGTIEIKIDRKRMEHQEDQLEDEIHEAKKQAFKAGGIDGGFDNPEDVMDILQV
jgi:SNF2 family DNA or RNA helicase